MKKWIAALLTLTMVLLCAAAAAEEPASGPDPEAAALFDSMWTQDFRSVRITPDGDRWSVQVINGSAEWDYTCVYDAERKALVSDPEGENVKYTVVRNEEGSETDRVTVYSDGAAVFSLDEAGRLLWEDAKENAGADAAFEKIGWFESTWDANSGDTTYVLYCFWDVDAPNETEIHSGYKIEIERYEDEAYTHWYYLCAFDAEANILSSSMGVKEHSEREGEPLTVVYEDGQAEFILDDDGNLIWKDATEDAGEGLVFARSNG